MSQRLPEFRDHIARCREEGVTREEFFQTVPVALVAGGSVTFPQPRRAVATLADVESRG